MGLKKTDLQNNTKFIYRHSKGNVFTLKTFNNSSSVTCDILMNTIKGKAIGGNQYNIESITDKYLTMWDIQFGQKKKYKVKLEDIELTDIKYELY